MTAITALTENFTGAAAGTTVSTSNTIFSSVTGTGTSTIVVDPFLGGTNRMMQVVATGGTQDKYHEMDFPTTNLLWFTFDLDLGTTVVPSNTAVLTGYVDNTGTTKIFDLRLLSGGRVLQLRNVATAVWSSTALSASTKYRIWVQVKMSSPKVLRVMVMDAAGTTLLQDSGEQTATAAATTCGHLRIGALSSTTCDMRFGRLRGDNSTGPTITPPPTVTMGGPVVGSEPGSTVTLTANTTGGTGQAVVFTQTAGPAVVLSGTGNSRSFVAPAYWPSGSAPSSPVLTFQATYGAASATVDVTPNTHARWRKTSTGWMPVFSLRKVS